MKKTAIYTMLLTLFVTIFTACSSEDDLTPSGEKDNFYAADENATDEESVLRRNFFNETGIYLFFNDTIRHEYIGKDGYGEDLWKTETLDLNYTFTYYGSAYFKYEFFNTNAEKRNAAEFFKKHILTHIQGGSLEPFSILLVNNLLYDSYGTEKYAEETDSYNGSRCMVLNLGSIASMDEEEADEFSKDILYDMVKNNLNDNSNYNLVYKPMYAVSDEACGGVSYHGEYFEDLFDGWSDADWDKNPSLLYQYGFLSYKGSARYGYYFPYMSTDLQNYLDRVWENDPEGFYEEFADYPYCIMKYDLIRNYILSIGYKF